MAYKFQLGAFTASGSIKAEEGFDANNTDIDNVDTGSFAFVSSSGDIVANGIMLGDASGIITGVLQDSNGQIELQLASDGGLQEASNELEIKLPVGSGLAADSNGLKIDAGGVTNAMLSGSIANSKLLNNSLSFGGVTVALGGSDASPAFNLADATGLPISTGVNGLGANVATFLGTPNSANLISAVTDETGTGNLVFSNSPALTTPNIGTPSAGNLSSCTSYPGDSSLVTVGALNAGSITSGFGGINNGSSAITTTGTGSFGKVVISGDLVVQGSTTTIDSATIEVTGGISFEGSTNDGFETTLDVIDPSADRTISLPDLSADATLAAFSDSSFAAANITPSPITLSELNILDGGTAATSTTLVDADRFICNDDGTMKQVAISDLKVYMSSLGVLLADDTDDLEPGFNYLADLAGAESVNLPASPSVGDVVYVKAPSNCSSTNTLTINRQGSHTIDGLNSIVLESAHAAVSIIYVVANTWKIF